MTQELPRFATEITPGMQINTERLFDRTFWEYPAHKLANTLVDAVEDYFLASGAVVAEKAQIIDYVKRARGIFAEQIKAFQADARQLEPSPAAQQATFSALVRTFIHDYVVTPTGIPGYAAPAAASERDAIVTDIFQNMGAKFKTELTHAGAAIYQPK